jgi:hypothetical protein
MIIKDFFEQGYHILILDFNMQNKVNTVRHFFRIVVQNLNLFSELKVDGANSEIRTASAVAF